MTATDQPVSQAEDVVLKACPFCGSPAEVERDGDHHGTWYNLGCSRHWGKSTDDQCIAGRIFYTESDDGVPFAEAAAAWNTRAALTQTSPAAGEGDGACQTCGARNPIWFAPDAVWNAVAGSPNGVLCPTCFMQRSPDRLWRVDDGRQDADAKIVADTLAEMQRKIEELTGARHSMYDPAVAIARSLAALAPPVSEALDGKGS